MDFSVSQNVRKNRSKILRVLSDKLQNTFINSQIGRARKVLFESNVNGLVSGLTDNYIRVQIKGDNSLLNTIQKVQITENIGISAIGQLLN